MFRDCKSLISVPKNFLQSTTMNTACYNCMFLGCNSMTDPPDLPATTLSSKCYTNLFNGCSKLNSITVAFTNWITGATSNWVTGVSSNGTFYCPSSLGDNGTITRGNNYCPSNWTVVNI